MVFNLNDMNKKKLQIMNVQLFVEITEYMYIFFFIHHVIIKKINIFFFYFGSYCIFIAAIRTRT